MGRDILTFHSVLFDFLPLCIDYFYWKTSTKCLLEGSILRQVLFLCLDFYKKNFNYRFSGCPSGILSLGCRCWGRVLGISLSCDSVNQSGLRVTTEASGKKALSSAAQMCEDMRSGQPQPLCFHEMRTQGDLIQPKDKATHAW